MRQKQFGLQNGYRVYTGEDIDRLIVSLQPAEQNAAIMTDMLMDMKRKFPNPPLLSWLMG